MHSAKKLDKFAGETNYTKKQKLMTRKLVTILFALLRMCTQAKKKVKLVCNGKMGHLHPNCIPNVSSDDDEVTLSSDSTIYDATVVIRDQFGNVMHQSTQTITPMESTIFVPDTGDGSEKCTIDLYYDKRHLSGTFEE